MAKRIAPKMTRPTSAPRWVLNWSQTSHHWLRGGRTAASTRPGLASVIADPRVKDAVEHVGDQVEEHRQRGEDEGERLHHRQVVGIDRRDQELAESVQ